MKSYRTIIVISILSLLGSIGWTRQFDNIINNKPIDVAFSRMILGTWWGEYDLGNAISYGETTYSSDGNAEGFIVFYEKSQNKKGSVLQNVIFKNKWKIDNGKLISYDLYSEPSIFPKDEIILDKVIELNSDKVIFMSLSDNSIFYRFKKK